MEISLRPYCLFLLGINFILFPENSLAKKIKTDEFAGLLPPGNGREQVINNCNQCHSIKLVVQNKMTREGWDQTITKMQVKHDLWELEIKERKQVLDYLSQNFHPTQKGPSLDGEMGPRKVNPLPSENP